MPKKPFGNVKSSSSSTAPKPDLSGSSYRPKKGYRPGGVFDPAVVEATRLKREPKADYKPPSQMRLKDNESRWKRDPATSAQGAMIRTNTQNPKLAVAREKVQELRKAKAKEAKRGGKA